MAKESMKAREVKRAKLVAKYAKKKAELKAAGDYEGLQLLPKNASTTVARSPVVRKATCVSSVFHVFSSAKWLLPVSSPV